MGSNWDMGDSVDRGGNRAATGTWETAWTGVATAWETAWTVWVRVSWTIGWWTVWWVLTMGAGWWVAMGAGMWVWVVSATGWVRVEIWGVTQFFINIYFDFLDTLKFIF